MTREEERKPPLSLGNQPAPPEKPQLKRQILDNKQQILSNMNAKFTGEETSRWLAHMDQSPASAAETIVPGSLIDESALSMPAVLDIIFDAIQRYVFELNQNPIEEGVKIQVQRPHGYQERIIPARMNQKVRFMRGHITMRDWTLIVYAEDTAISIFVLRTEFLMGFSPEQTDFTAYMTMKKSETDTWSVSGSAVGVSTVPKITRRFIAHLVRVARGEADSSQVFTFSSGRSLDEQMLEPDRSFEELPDKDVGLHPGIQQQSQPLADQKQQTQTGQPPAQAPAAYAPVAQPPVAQPAAQPPAAQAPAAQQQAPKHQAPIPPGGGLPPSPTAVVAQQQAQAQPPAPQAAPVPQAAQTPVQPAVSNQTRSQMLKSRMQVAAAEADTYPGQSPVAGNGEKPPVDGQASGNLQSLLGGIGGAPDAAAPADPPAPGGQERPSPSNLKGPPPGFGMPTAEVKEMRQSGQFQPWGKPASGEPPEESDLPKPVISTPKPKERPDFAGLENVLGQQEPPAASPQAAPAQSLQPAPAPEPEAEPDPQPQAPEEEEAPLSPAWNLSPEPEPVSATSPQVSPPPTPPPPPAEPPQKPQPAAQAPTTPEPQSIQPPQPAAQTPTTPEPQSIQPPQPAAQTPTTPEPQSIQPPQPAAQTPITPEPQSAQPPQPTQAPKPGAQPVTPAAQPGIQQPAQAQEPAAASPQPAQPPPATQTPPRPSSPHPTPPPQPEPPQTPQPSSSRPAQPEPAQGPGQAGQRPVTKLPEVEPDSPVQEQLPENSGAFSTVSMQDIAKSVEKEASLPAATEKPRNTLQSLLRPDAAAPAKAEAKTDFEQIVSEAERGIVDGCQQLQTKVDSALKVLKDAGVDAMQNDNMDQVASIMQYQKRLKTLKEKLAELSTELTS